MSVDYCRMESLAVVYAIRRTGLLRPASRPISLSLVGCAVAAAQLHYGGHSGLR